jgi:hypothetical protein
MFHSEVSVPLELIWFCVAAAGLSLGCLVLEFFAPRRVAQGFSGGLGLALVAGGGAVWLATSQALPALGVAMLSLPCLGTWSLYSPAARRVAAWVVTPRSIWGMTLVLGLCGAHLLSAHFGRLHDLPLEHLVDLQPDPVPGFEALTDASRPVPVFKYQPSDQLAELERWTLTDSRFANQVIRLAAPTGDCNCHGWAFTGGKFAIRGTDVPTILADNGYGAVREPQAGDLAIYTGPEGDVTHTGIVRSIDPDSGLILIESKWGALGVYLHAPEAQPFGRDYTFYRSQRSGHRLGVMPSSSRPAEVVFRPAT